MNRIYRIIFSKTRKTNIVCSEIAKNHGIRSLKATASIVMAASVIGIAKEAISADYDWKNGLTPNSDGMYTKEVTGNGVYADTENYLLDGEDPAGTKNSLTLVNKGNGNQSVIQATGNKNVELQNFKTLKIELPETSRPHDAALWTHDGGKIHIHDVARFTASSKQGTLLAKGTDSAIQVNTSSEFSAESKEHNAIYAEEGGQIKLTSSSNTSPFSVTAKNNAVYAKGNTSLVQIGTDNQRVGATTIQSGNNGLFTEDGGKIDVFAKSLRITQNNTNTYLAAIYGGGGGGTINVDVSDDIDIDGHQGINATYSTDIDIHAGGNLTVSTADNAIHLREGTLDVSAKNMFITANKGYGIYSSNPSNTLKAKAEQKLKITASGTSAIRGQVTVLAKELEINTSSGAHAIMTNGDNNTKTGSETNIGTADNPLDRIIINGISAEGNHGGSAIYGSRHNEIINLYAKEISGQVTEDESFIYMDGANNGTVNLIASDNIDITGNISNVSAQTSQDNPRSNTTININSNGTAKITLKGDIVTSNNETTGEGTTGKNNTVNIRLSSSDSNLDGAIYDKGDYTLGGTHLTLTNGAVWNVTGDSAVKTINSENAIINNRTEAEIRIDELKTAEGTNTTYHTGSTTEGQLRIENKQGALTISLNSRGTEQLGGNNTEETAGKLVAIAEIENGDKAVTYTAEESAITGKLEVNTDENGHITRIAEAKNDVMESLKEIEANSFLVFRSQMNDLDKRMGDLRTMPQTDGAWARIIAGQSQYKNEHNTWQTLQVGIDKRIGNFLIGATASTTDGDGNLKNGSTDDKNYNFGLYGSWFNDDGQFIDVTVKRHHMESDYDLRYTDGTRAKGSFNTSGTSISAEYGWRLGIANTRYYIEPQIEFMYGHLNSFGYRTSNGVTVKQDALKTAVGRLGMAAGWISPEKTGSAYLKISVLNDWEGKSDSRASKNGTSRRYHEDMGGTWAEYALGGTYNLSKNLSAYGEMETTSGNPVRTTYQVSAGLRYSF